MTEKNIRLVIAKVNKYEAKWDPAVLFRGFRIRAVLATHQDAVSSMQHRHLLHRKMTREFGVEGDDWHLDDNPITHTIDLYLKNSGQLVMWKLQDMEAFSKLFDFVEQHVETVDEIGSSSE